MKPTALESLPGAAAEAPPPAAVVPDAAAVVADDDESLSLLPQAVPTSATPAAMASAPIQRLRMVGAPPCSSRAGARAGAAAPGELPAAGVGESTSNRCHICWWSVAGGRWSVVSAGRRAQPAGD